MRRDLRSLAHDERGGIAILGGLVLSATLGVGALAVDVGHMFAARRQVQSTADLAAIAAASDLSQAARAAGATVRVNRLAEDALRRVETGTYSADPALAPADRFKPASATTANAARVSLQTTTPLFIGRLLTGRDSADIRTTAIASRTAFASFAIGSGLVSLEGGILNALLGSMLGTSLSLSAMNYQSLLSANIDLFKFSEALATRLNVTAGTYASLLESNVKLADVAAALAEAGRDSGSASVQALTALATALRGSSTRIPLGAVLSLGPYSGMTIGQRPQFGLTANALDIVSAMAQVANGANQAAASLDAGLPGITDVSVQLVIGERARGTSWIAVGGPGTSVHTAQTRLLITATLLGSGSIAAVRLPIYLELASAQATLTAVSCGASPSATINVRPAVLDAWIGDVTPAMMKNVTAAPNPGAATLVELPLIKVRGRAHATITNMAAQPLTFSQSDAARQTKKVVSTTDFTASLLTRLIGDLDVQVSMAGLGLGLGLPGAVESAVVSIITQAARPLDRLLSTILAALGVRLGQAHVWTTGIRCDGAVLVN